MSQRTTHSYGVRVFVLPAPSDAGVAIGSVWLLEAPHRHDTAHTFSGIPLWDADALPTLSGPTLVITNNAAWALVPLVAHLLVHGAVLGIVRGRQEFGSRALGHRSLLAYPEGHRQN